MLKYGDVINMHVILCGVGLDSHKSKFWKLYCFDGLLVARNACLLRWSALWYAEHKQI